ncbi:MAG TPA: hypothetical protein VHT91_29335 [Kofleriaceae bacterium]|jgi:hypothetical protein|nr:hypothetical protein [Kofleriaceae bacterium]
MSELGLAAALYFDHELAADPAPLATLWKQLAKPASLRQWWATAKASTKPKPLDVDALVAKVASGDTTRAAVESEQRGFLAFAQTTPLAALDEGVPPRQWKYDAVVAIGPRELATIGRSSVIDALCTFAGAVAAKAGIIVWSPSLAYASALAMLSSGSDLTQAQASRVTDSYYWRTHWGRVIRGPEWGTFLGAAHVAVLGDLARLPAARIVPLSSGGAYVQATADPLDIDAPSPDLDRLRTALAPVMPAAQG